MVKSVIDAGTFRDILFKKLLSEPRSSNQFNYLYFTCRS